MGGLLKWAGTIAVAAGLYPFWGPTVLSRLGVLLPPNFLESLLIYLPWEVAILVGLLVLGIGEMCERLTELNRNLAKKAP